MISMNHSQRLAPTSIFGPYYFGSILIQVGLEAVLHLLIRQLEAENDANRTLRAVENPWNLCHRGRRVLGIFPFKVNVQSSRLLRWNFCVRSKTLKKCYEARPAAPTSAAHETAAELIHPFSRSRIYPTLHKGCSRVSEGERRRRRRARFPSHHKIHGHVPACGVFGRAEGRRPRSKCI
jgi:hypothetical protein